MYTSCSYYTRVTGEKMSQIRRAFAYERNGVISQPHLSLCSSASARIW
jgi:hypothetical protein